MCSLQPDTNLRLSLLKSLLQIWSTGLEIYHFAEESVLPHEPTYSRLVIFVRLKKKFSHQCSLHLILTTTSTLGRHDSSCYLLLSSLLDLVERQAQSEPDRLNKLEPVSETDRYATELASNKDR